MALTGVEERLSHGAVTFFCKKSFLMLWEQGHHDRPTPHLWAAAPAGVQEELLTTEPERFFRPPYVGHRGWIGLDLSGDLDWEEVAEICGEAWRAVAPPKRLAERPRNLP